MGEEEENPEEGDKKEQGDNKDEGKRVFFLFLVLNLDLWLNLFNYYANVTISIHSKAQLCIYKR